MTSNDGQRASDAGSPSRHADDAAALLSIAQAAGSTIDLAEVLDRVASTTASVTGADRCSIWLLDDDRELLVPAALHGMDHDFTARWKRRILSLKDELLSQEAITSGSPVVVANAEADPRTDKRAVALFGDKSILVVPLLAKGQAIGTLFLNHVGQPHNYTDQDVEITMAVASQAAVAIENAQLYAESRRKSDELTNSFQRIGDALATGRDLGETLQMIVDLATEMVHAEIGCLELLGSEGDLFARAAAGIPVESCRSRMLSNGDRLAEGVLQTAKPLRVASLATNPTPYHGNVFGDETGTYLGVPLRVRGRLIGVLAVYHRRPDRFPRVESELIETFANQAAAAIDNARLFATLQDHVDELSRAMTENASLVGSLRAEKERLDAIVKNSSDSMFIVDRQLRLHAFNPAAEQLTGWSAAEALGATCADVLHCNHRIGELVDAACLPLCPMLRVLAAGESLPYLELTMITRDGKTRDLAASYSYIPGFAQPTSAYFANSALSSAVISATTGPFGVAILRDISRIKEVERLKSDFVSMVSHELRTPLTVIKGFAATLLNPALKIERARELRFIKGINDNSDRLVRLIDNLLSVSRLESGRFRLNASVFDLDEIVLREAGIFRASALKHQITTNSSDHNIRIHADRDQITQVLTNLLSNAVKYSPDGGEIRISVVEHPAGIQQDHAPRAAIRMAGPLVEVSVADEGIGIPKAQAQRIFEKYYRGDVSLTHQASGTGLGLFICKSIIDAHGGQIWAESADTRGSIIRFIIPVAVATAAPIIGSNSVPIIVTPPVADIDVEVAPPADPTDRFLAENQGPGRDHGPPPLSCEVPK